MTGVKCRYTFYELLVSVTPTFVQGLRRERRACSDKTAEKTGTGRLNF